MTHKGVVIELRRLDTALTKAELIDHIRSDHSGVPTPPDTLSKSDLVTLHRLIHVGIDR